MNAVAVAHATLVGCTIVDAVAGAIGDGAENTIVRNRRKKQGSIACGTAIADAPPSISRSI